MAMLYPNRSRVHAIDGLCRDCQACTLACSLFHEGQCHLGLARLRVAKRLASGKVTIHICQHCEEPACLDACPTDAMWLDERGVVILDDANCIRCGSCAAACPYDAIFYCKAEDRYLKCDLCAGREGGPLCTTICPVGALVLTDDGRKDET